MAASEIITVLGSGAFSVIVGRMFAHRETMRRIDAEDAAAMAAQQAEHYRAEREASQRVLMKSEERERDCNKRVDSLADRVDELQGRLMLALSDNSDTLVKLARCEEKHEAMEERVLRLERKSDNPEPARFLR